MDFTTNKLTQLYQALLEQGFSFITFKQYLQESRPDQFAILRHDVEQKYANALKFAQIQHDLGISGSYYFRILPKCFQPRIVKQVADLGHEIGYHYDDLTYCKGDFEKAVKRFEKNLQMLRNIAPVNTICMDGSPLSKYDNKDIWLTNQTQTPNPEHQNLNAEPRTLNAKRPQGKRQTAEGQTLNAEP